MPTSRPIMRRTPPPTTPRERCEHALDDRDRVIADLQAQLAEAHETIDRMERQRLELAATGMELREFAARAEQLAMRVQKRVAGAPPRAA